MRPPVSRPVSGSQQTVLAYAVQQAAELQYVTRNELQSMQMDLDAVDRLAAQNASAELAKLQPKFIRNRQKVIEFAVLDSDSALTASTVLAPDFGEKFASTLGPELLIAIPNRQRVYIFPSQASRFQEAAGMVLRDYETAIYPVSKEVFALRNGKLRAIGEFRLPSE